MDCFFSLIQNEGFRDVFVFNAISSCPTIFEDQALKYYHKIPFPDFAVTSLLKLFHRYALIGGMPEIVGKYIENKNIAALASVYQGLLVAYLDDVSKYARNPTMARVIEHAIESAPHQSRAGAGEPGPNAKKTF